MNIFKKIEAAMVAVTFAQAGEHQTALDYLKGSKNAHKKVLLGTDLPEISPKAIKCSMGLCQRIGGVLEIFHLFSPKEIQSSGGKFIGTDMKDMSVLKEQLKRQGIIYQPTVKNGLLTDELGLYATNRRDILSLLILKNPLHPEGLPAEFIARFTYPVIVLDNCIH